MDQGGDGGNAQGLGEAVPQTARAGAHVVQGTPTEAVSRAIADLWRLRPPAPNNLFAAPAFVRLQAACEAAYPGAGRGGGLTFALGNALRSLGLPCGLPTAARRWALPADQAALFLDSACRRHDALRLHMCPLDLADDLPTLSFGPATIRRFTADDLRGLVDATRLRRVFPNAVFEAERFEAFHWLVVEERVRLNVEPGARAVPVLFMDLSQDLGRIEPHKGRFPPAVEDALFFTLLAPWEDWAEMRGVDWRGFRIPWVYTVDEDLFVRPQPPPSPDTLSWELHSFDDGYGNTIEKERPVRLPLDDAAAAGLGGFDNSRWATVMQACRSALFQTPIAHFFVRAFLAEHVDEFLAHITTIEAALGSRSDYNRTARPKPDRHKGPSATQRMAARVAAHLGRAGFAKDYEHLFNSRSEFLHGRAMGTISTDDRVLARRLARQVVSELVQAASGPPVAREVFLDFLLDQGAGLNRPAT